MVLRTMAALCALVAMMSNGLEIHAQWMAANSCGCQVRPVVTNPCSCRPAPVMRSCYRQVPVTQYRQVKRIVRKPVVKREYVDKKVTCYRQVVEKQEVQVPTVSYRNVTEYQCRKINCGRWVTQYVPNRKCTPCQYNNRPGLLHDIDRIGYAIRSSFKPSHSMVRRYIPRTVVQQIPVNRQVAVHGTRTVTRNVARIVPYTTTQKVAIDRVKYVDQEVVAMEPYTVVRTIPIGPVSTFASAPIIMQESRTALRPSPDPKSAERDSKSKQRADSRANKYERDIKPDRSSDRRSNERDGQRSSVNPLSEDTPDTAISQSLWRPTRTKVTPTVPSIVRVSGWRSQSRTSRPTGPQLSAPSLVASGN